MTDTDAPEPSDSELMAAFDVESTVGVSSRRLLAKVLESTVGLRVDPVELGRFELGRKLGAGGMGDVYEATDPVLGHEVAVKVLRRRSNDQLAVALREAQLMAGVVHDNLVFVHEVGIDDGQAWISMELVRGTTLRRWRAESGATWKQALEVYVRAGRGLTAAHERHVLHGDFKPDNVLVSDGPEPDVVKVTDFGLARRGSSGAGVGGTPEYMAPEQYLDGTLDEHSEQFSFCVALFEHLTGSHPYSRWSFDELAATMRSENAEVTIPEIRQHFCRELLRNMGARRLHWPRRPLRIPRRVRRALERGLAFDPGQRHVSMQSLLERLDIAQARRRRARWSGATLLGLVAGALGANGIMDHERASECSEPEARWSQVWNDDVRSAIELEHPKAVGELGLTLDRYGERWVAAHRQACERTVRRGEWSAWRPIRACLERRLDAAEAVVQRLGGSNRPLQMVHELLTRLPETCALDTVSRASPPEGAEEAVDQIERGLAVAFAAEVAGAYDEGLVTMEDVVHAARALGYAPLLAESLLQRGRLRIQQAIYDQRTVDTSVIPGVNDLELAELHAATSFARSTFIDAWVFRNKVLAVAGNAPPVDEEALELSLPGAVLADQRAELLETLGLVSYNLAQSNRGSEASRVGFDRALELYAEALELRIAARDGVGRAKLLENMGNALVSRGDPEDRAEARRRYDEALNFWRSFDEGSRYFSHLYANRINATMLDDVDEAHEIVVEALAVLERDEEERLVVVLTAILAAWADPEAALRFADAGMGSLRSDVSVDPLHEIQLRIFALGALIRSARASDRRDDAATWAEALAPQLERPADLLPPIMAALGWSYVGRARLLTGALLPAREALERAEELGPGTGLDAVERAELELALGVVRQEIGDHAAARSAFAEAEEWCEAVEEEYGAGAESPANELRARLERHRVRSPAGTTAGSAQGSEPRRRR